MKNTKISRLIIILIVIYLHQSCSPKQKPDNIYNEKSFTEIQKISQEVNLPFCLILYDSSQVASKEYIERLYYKKNNMNPNRGLFNLINITFDENKWYEKLLSPQLIPLTCVFAASGELIDLVPGSSKESLSYTEKALITQKANLEFHYNRKYDVEKIKIINNMNNILQLRFKVDQEENVIAILDTLFNKVRHPYLLFLKLQNQLQFKDTIAAKNTAKDLF